MKNIITIFLLFVAVSRFGFGQGFYDVNTVNTIRITFTQSNWKTILDGYIAAGSDARLMGTALINGVFFDSIGVKFKGNSSYSVNNKKNPLSIKLDYVKSGQTIDGYGTLRLSNVFKDPSFVREVLGHEIARKYLPSSLANYINVYVNGVLIGLYSSTQDIDALFTKNHFYSSSNPKFKGEIASGTPQPIITWGYFGTDSTAYKKYYEMESAYGWQELINFLNVLNNNNSQVENVLNLDRHLWMLAFDYLLVNLDAPINYAHNYYLYSDNSGRFNPIIWDLNECFGVFSRLMTGGSTLTTTQLQQLSPFLNSTSSTYPIVSKILSNPSYKKMYVAHVKTMIEENFSNQWYKTRALQIQSVIDQHVQADINKFFTYANFISNVNTAVGASIGISQLMDARVTYLNTVSEFQKAAPVITDISHSGTSVQPNSVVYVNAKISNATIIKLAHRSSLTAKFIKIDMLDDGNNNDGAAGDGVYGGKITVGAADVQYYIYAENNDAAAFSPKRAEYEYYKMPVNKTVVINEFMANNKTIVTDPSGQYDDWIELYNNSNSTVALKGYYLTDDITKLTKWAFPEIFIPSQGFIIVWADEDLNQQGLHSNFKLSAAGEAIYLVNKDTLIIDEIIYGAQQTDTSMGRFPNGTGNFIKMSPTFGTSNVNGIVSSSEDKTNIPNEYLLEQNYPNPFNPVTVIKYGVRSKEYVVLKVYDLLGREVAVLVNEQKPAGKYSVTFEAAGLASGVYFYSLSAGEFVAAKKLILMK